MLRALKKKKKKFSVQLRSVHQENKYLAELHDDDDNHSRECILTQEV